MVTQSSSSRGLSFSLAICQVFLSSLSVLPQLSKLTTSALSFCQAQVQIQVRWRSGDGQVTVRGGSRRSEIGLLTRATYTINLAFSFFSSLTQIKDRQVFVYFLERSEKYVTFPWTVCDWGWFIITICFLPLLPGSLEGTNSPDYNLFILG